MNHITADANSTLLKQGGVLLINPGHEPAINASHRLRKVSRETPPYFALRLGAYLQANNVHVDILDTHIEEDWEAILRRLLSERTYSVIGFTVYLGMLLRNERDLSEMCRELSPDSRIVWGGPVASSTPGEALETYDIDFAVRFEGEETLLELVTALNNGSDTGDIRGLSYLEHGKVRHNLPRLQHKDGLSGYPIPAWNLVEGKINNQQVPYYASIMGSDGCPYKCNFCYHQASDNPGSPSWRSRTVSHIMDEVDMLNEKFGITVFSFGDDNFLVRKDRVLEIFEEFRKRNYLIEELSGHFGNFRNEVIEGMENLVGRATFSVESASERLLKIINKNIPLDRVPDTVGKLFDCGIQTSTIFIIGLPTETEQDLKDTFEFMHNLRWRHPQMTATSCILQPIPETQMVPILEEICNVKVPIDLKSLEYFCEVPFTDLEFKSMRKFVPHISEDRFKLLQGFQVIFREIFRYNKLSPQSLDWLQVEPRLAHIFEGHEDIPRPKDGYQHYMLDQVLKGKKSNWKKLLHDNVILPERAPVKPRGYQGQPVTSPEPIMSNHN